MAKKHIVISCIVTLLLIIELLPFSSAYIYYDGAPDRPVLEYVSYFRLPVLDMIFRPVGALTAIMTLLSWLNVVLLKKWISTIIAIVSFLTLFFNIVMQIDLQHFIALQCVVSIGMLLSTFLAIHMLLFEQK